MDFCMRRKQAHHADSSLFNDSAIISTAFPEAGHLYQLSNTQFILLTTILPHWETEKDWSFLPCLCMIYCDLFTVYCSSTAALVCMLGTPAAPWGVLNYSRRFSQSPSFIRFFLHFAGRMCVCLYLLFESMWCLSTSHSPFYYSQRASKAALLWLHDMRGERNDSSSEQSLEQERSGNNLLFPFCTLLYCLCFAVALPLLSHLTILCLHLLSLFISVFLQIPTLWGTTVLTMPWLEEWWL